MWRRACLSCRISLSYSVPQPASYYRDKVRSYLSHLAALKHKTAWSTTSVSDVTSAPAHTSRALGLTANSSHIYSGGDDRHLRSWDLVSHVMLAERQGMSTSCLDCTESHVAAGLYNGCIMIFDRNLSRVVTTCSRHMGPVYDVKWAPDSSTVVSGSSDCTVRVWGVTENSNTCIHVFRGHDTMINKILLMWDAAASRVFSLDIACINVWCVKEKKKLSSLRPHNSVGKEGYFQPGLIHSRYLHSNSTECDVVVCGSNNGIYMWDAHSYALLRLIQSEGYVCAEHIVGAGSSFIVSTYDDGIAIINSVTGQHECTVAVPQFNNTNCGIWLNRHCGWLNGVGFGDGDPVFVVTTFAGDITSFSLDHKFGNSLVKNAVKQ